MSVNGKVYDSKLLLHYPEKDPFSDAAQERLNNLIHEFLSTGVAFANGASVEDVREASQSITRAQTGGSDDIASGSPPEGSTSGEDDDDYPDHQTKRLDKGKARDEREGPGVSGLWSHIGLSEHTAPLNANAVEIINILSDDSGTDESVHDDVEYEGTDGCYDEDEDGDVHGEEELNYFEDEVQSISSTGTELPHAPSPIEAINIDSDEEGSIQEVSHSDSRVHSDDDSEWIRRTARDDDGDGDYDEGVNLDPGSNNEAEDNSYVQENSVQVDDEEQQLPSLYHGLGKESDDEGGGVLEDEESFRNMPLLERSSADPPSQSQQSPESASPFGRPELLVGSSTSFRPALPPLSTVVSGLPYQIEELPEPGVPSNVVDISHGTRFVADDHFATVPDIQLNIPDPKFSLNLPTNFPSFLSSTSSVLGVQQTEQMPLDPAMFNMQRSTEIFADLNPAMTASPSEATFAMTNQVVSGGDLSAGKVIHDLSNFISSKNDYSLAPSPNEASDHPVITETPSSPGQTHTPQDATNILISEVVKDHPGDIILSDYIISQVAVDHTPSVIKSVSPQPDGVNDDPLSVADHEDITMMPVDNYVSTNLAEHVSTSPENSIIAPERIREEVHTIPTNTRPSLDRSDDQSDVASATSSSSRISRLLMLRSPSPIAYPSSRSPSVQSQVSSFSADHSSNIPPPIRPYIPHNHSHHPTAVTSVLIPLSKQPQTPRSRKSSPSPSASVSPSQSTSTHMTRARCTDHKISFPGSDGLLYFLVPRCSLLDPEVEKDKGIADCGVATKEEVSSAVGDLEAVGLDSATLGVIRQLTGVTLMREGQVGYLPRPGERIGHRVKPKAPRIPPPATLQDPELDAESPGSSEVSSHIILTNLESPTRSVSRSGSSVHEGSLYEPSSDSDRDTKSLGGGRRLKRKKGQSSYATTAKQSDIDSPSPKKRKK